MDKAYYKEIWALRDVHFSLQKGDRLALLGDNGSGKTTLFRVLAGIYRSTAGTVRINGKLTGLFQFEVGMDRDLSVLDNLYLFGAIVGLHRKEIRKRLDAILDFSELKEFVHLPLRDTSMGAIGRLAIAILRESDSDIVFFDEILAGGDLGFREKCLNIFEGFKAAGKSLILSSHDLSLVERICDKALLLDGGRQVAFGPVREVVEIYRKQKQKGPTLD